LFSRVRGLVDASTVLGRLADRAGGFFGTSPVASSKGSSVARMA
jgi:hypothetical protein